MCNIKSFQLNYDQPSSLQFLHQHFFSTRFPIGQTGFSASVCDFLSHPSASPTFANFALLAKFPKKSSKFSLFFRTAHSVSNPVCPQLIRFKIKKPCCFHNKVHIGQTGFSASVCDFLSHPSASPTFANFALLAKFPKKSSKFSLFFRTAHSVSNPVCPQLIRFKIKKPCCFHNKVHIGQTGFEPATSWSQTRRATSCATARLMY